MESFVETVDRVERKGEMSYGQIMALAREVAEDGSLYTLAHLTQEQRELMLAEIDRIAKSRAQIAIANMRLT